MLRKLPFHKPGENNTSDGYPQSEIAFKKLKQHVESTGGQVRTRFPPEPNGILHIGHAKAININFGYAREMGGICFLRYDDTNPEKEEERFFNSILEMVQWLGFEPYQTTHSSDNFHQLYEWAKVLISKGMAYICHQRADEIKGFNPPPSPWRDRPVHENLSLFEDMKNGKFEEGTATLRMKITLEEGKQDPVAYRIKYVPHHRTKNEWCIYPTYDFTHCLCDSLENITHSLCTKEFQNRRSSYYWLCEAVETYIPVQWEYGRLNMGFTVLSKRKIAKLIEEKIVDDWDDPRLFTLPALRRRGIPAEAINEFCLKMGITGSQMTAEPAMLEACARDILNVKATRTMVVIDPIKVTITNVDESKIGLIDAPDFPADPNTTMHKISFDKIVYIDRDDFRETIEKGFKRFAPGQTVGLKYIGLIVSCDDIIKDSNGKIIELKVSTSTAKPKAWIHWVANPIDIKVCFYERLFNHRSPEDKSEVPGGFLTDCNPNSLVINTSKADKHISSIKPYTQFQFERHGFFSLDPKSTKESLIFNRTVSLKEDKEKNVPNPK